jgi:hypothetical protein
MHPSLARDRAIGGKNLSNRAAQERSCALAHSERDHGAPRKIGRDMAGKENCYARFAIAEYPVCIQMGFIIKISTQAELKKE